MAGFKKNLVKFRSSNFSFSNLLPFLLTPVGLVLLVVIVFKFSVFKNWFTNLFFSVTDTTPKSKARSLYRAMSSFGTDEKTIFDVLLNITEKEYMSIYNAFGLRPYNSDLGADLPPFNEDMDLNQWLQSELSSSDRKKLTNSDPYLKKFGI